MKKYTLEGIVHNFLVNSPFKNTLLKNRKKYFWKILLFTLRSDQGSWGRALENGGVLQLQRSKEGAAHPLAGNQCQPPQTYFVCQLSKSSPGKYSYESWVERAAKVVKFIKSVGRLVGWTWHSPQRSWRRWPRLMSTCCFSSWLVLTFKESNYRSRSFFAHGVRVCPRNIASTIHFLNEFSFSLHCVSLPMLAVCNQSHFGEQLICCDL